MRKTAARIGSSSAHTSHSRADAQVELVIRTEQQRARAVAVQSRAPAGRSSTMVWTMPARRRTKGVQQHDTVLCRRVQLAVDERHAVTVSEIAGDFLLQVEVAVVAAVAQPHDFGAVGDPNTRLPSLSSAMSVGWSVPRLPVRR